MMQLFGVLLSVVMITMIYDLLFMRCILLCVDGLGKIAASKQDLHFAYLCSCMQRRGKQETACLRVMYILSSCMQCQHEMSAAPVFSYCVLPSHKHQCTCVGSFVVLGFYRRAAILILTYNLC